MRRRFFVDRFESGSATIHGQTAEHLGRVLRAEAGQLYELSDGEQVWLGRIDRVSLPKRADGRIEFTLIERISTCEPSLSIELLIAVVKFDRFEWCLEKATELGVTEIVPLAANRTDKPLLAAAGNRHGRWERIVVESAQQSRRLRPPIIREVARPERAFAQSTADCKILLSESCEAPHLREALGSVSGMKTASLAVGPEGGWTAEETPAARTAGFKQASLGENILRTETAVVVALANLRFAAGI